MRQRIGLSSSDIGVDPVKCCLPPEDFPIVSALSKKRQCSSGVEQLFRKQQVMGSNPITGSLINKGFAGD
jgi:hypothetical protein